jgi:hypothetical protein
LCTGAPFDIRENHYMQIRRKLVALVAPLFIVPAILAVSATTANAAITTNCTNNISICVVHEDMGSGYCEGDIFQQDANGTLDPFGSFAQATGVDFSTGYTCNFYLQRNVNGTGWYTIDTFSVPSSGSPVTTPNVWNGLGYAARICLQFNWGSSLGTVHCSNPVWD